MHIEDLTGKVISITIQDDNINHDFIDPKFETIHGRVFVTGTIPKGHTESGWTDSCPGGIAWDRVTDYIIFDSVESYQYATKKSSEIDE